MNVEVTITHLKPVLGYKAENFRFSLVFNSRTLIVNVCRSDDNAFKTGFQATRQSIYRAYKTFLKVENGFDMKVMDGTASKTGFQATQQRIYVVGTASKPVLGYMEENISSWCRI